MRSVMIALLILAFPLSVGAKTPAQNYARQVRQQCAKAVAMARAAQKKAEAAAKIEARKRAADPAYAAAQEERERQAKAFQEVVVPLVILGVIGSALGGEVGPTNPAAGEDPYDALQRRREYWLDRARREAAAGNDEEARSSLERAR